MTLHKSQALDVRRHVQTTGATGERTKDSETQQQATAPQEAKS